MEGAQHIYKAPQYPLFYTFCCTKETMRCSILLFLRRFYMWMRCTFTPHLDYFYEKSVTLSGKDFPQLCLTLKALHR